VCERVIESVCVRERECVMHQNESNVLHVMPPSVPLWNGCVCMCVCEKEREREGKCACQRDSVCHASE